MRFTTFRADSFFFIFSPPLLALSFPLSFSLFSFFFHSFSSHQTHSHSLSHLRTESRLPINPTQQQRTHRHSQQPQPNIKHDHLDNPTWVRLSPHQSLKSTRLPATTSASPTAPPLCKDGESVSFFVPCLVLSCSCR